MQPLFNYLSFFVYNNIFNGSIVLFLNISFFLLKRKHFINQSHDGKNTYQNFLLGRLFVQRSILSAEHFARILFLRSFDSHFFLWLFWKFYFCPHLSKVTLSYDHTILYLGTVGCTVGLQHAAVAQVATQHILPHRSVVVGVVPHHLGGAPEHTLRKHLDAHLLVDLLHLV